jgi:hypothetical protein
MRRCGEVSLWHVAARAGLGIIALRSKKPERGAHFHTIFIQKIVGQNG